MKRTNTTTEEAEWRDAFPQDVWLNVFGFIRNQRLLPWRSVSREWNKWILEEGLTEFAGFHHDFLKKVRNFGQYKRLDSLTMTTCCMTKAIFWKRGIEVFSQLKTLYLRDTEIPNESVYWKGLLGMTNLVSLRISFVNINIPENIIEKLPSLRTWCCMFCVDMFIHGSPN